jgi:hypothetical protein
MCAARRLIEPIVPSYDLDHSGATPVDPAQWWYPLADFQDLDRIRITPERPLRELLPNMQRQLESRLPGAPRVAVTNFAQLRPNKGDVVTTVGSYAPATITVDLEAIRDLTTERLHTAGRRVAFSGTATDELLITTIPQPSPNAVPRSYYQIRVVIFNDSGGATYSLLADVSVINLRDVNGILARTFQRDAFATELERLIFKAALKGATRK